jgi:hypothetical protein
VPLAYVGFLASNVFATQQSQGLTTAEALARLGMDSTSWIVQRSALAVALVVLSGLLRYRPPAAEASAADERERLARELELEPLRAQLRARKVAGLRDVAAAAMGKSTPADAPVTPAPAHDAVERPPRLPTGGGTPARHDDASASVDVQTGIHVVPSPARRRKKTPTKRQGVITASAEERARRAWSPGMTVSELARQAQIGRSAASKYARLLAANNQQDREEEVAL